jgi:hypothetical protein
MLDRLISGAGAVTDAADRSVRLLAGGSRGFATTRPGSVAVAAVLAILAALMVLAGLEATDDPTPVPLGPGEVRTNHRLADRTYTTMRGLVDASYVETFDDSNGNGSRDQGENGAAWYYWLVDPADKTGVTVRSPRPPSVIYTFNVNGVLIDDPHYGQEDVSAFAFEADPAGIQIDPAKFVDATSAVVGTAIPLDLTTTLPPDGTSVAVSGSRLGSFVSVCSSDPNRNGQCDYDEMDAYEIVVFDPASKHGIRVLVRYAPEFADATFTGLLRREESAVDEAKRTSGYDFGDLGLVISDRYILDDAAPPRSARLAFGLAGALVVVSMIILVGLAGGYLIYRRSDRGLPAPATTVAPGERIGLRISGEVRTPTGREHVREAPGELVRFVLGRRVPAADIAAPATATATVADATEPAGPPAASAEVEASPEPAADPAPGPSATTPTTTLLVERHGLPQGVALGRGEVTRLSSGQVMAFRGPRPAIRVAAGTGPLVLSFDTGAERDRAAAELLAEIGLGPDGRPTQSP